MSDPWVPNITCLFIDSAKDPVIEEANADDQRYQLLNDDEEQADHRHDEKTVS